MKGFFFSLPEPPQGNDRNGKLKHTSQYVSFRLPIPIVSLQGMFSQDMGCTLLLTKKNIFFYKPEKKMTKVQNVRNLNSLFSCSKISILSGVPL